MDLIKVHRVYRCDFCSSVFNTSSDKSQHTLSHFEQEFCEKCDQTLLSIGGNLYVLHTSITCIDKHIKTEQKFIDENVIDLQCNTVAEHFFETEPLQNEFSNYDENVRQTDQLEIKPDIDEVYQSGESNPYSDSNVVVFETEAPSIDVKVEPADENQLQNLTETPNFEENLSVIKNPRKRKYTRKLQQQLPQSQKPQQPKKRYMKHNISGRYCNICGLTFKRNYYLYVHTFRVHRPDEMMFKCDKCDKAFVEKHEVTKHQRRNIICNRCGLTFCSMNLLKSHKNDCESKTDNITKRQCQYGCNELVAANNWIEHLSTKHNDIFPRYECDICKKTFTEKTTIRTHILSRHCSLPAVGRNRYLKCDLCDYTSYSNNDLKAHFQRKHHKVCPECGKTFQSLNKLKEHRYIHAINDEIIPKTDTLTEKSKERSNESGLSQAKTQNTQTNRTEKQHLANPPNEPSSSDSPEKKKKKYMKHNIFGRHCNICGLTFKRNDYLFVHTYRVHKPTEKMFKCDKCESTFVANHELTRHNRRKIYCNRCGESFCTKALEQEHRLNTCESKYDGFMTKRQCKIKGCNEWVASNEWIHHMSQKHNELYQRYECDICKKTFAAKLSIRNHMLSNHCPKKAKPIKKDSGNHKHESNFNMNIHNYVCSECGKTFRKKNQLKLHSYTHTGEKPFQCPFEGCTKRFRSTSQPIEHMRMHTGEKPFVCPVDGCNRSFAYSVSLRRHKFSAHKIYTKQHPCQICNQIFPETVLLKRHMKNHENHL